jgi:asparagine synthase (glutamine-hydrolysing)
MSNVAEISAAVVERKAAATDATALLAGYAGPANAWVEGSIALAWSGSAEIGIFDDVVILVDGRLDNRRELAARYPIRAAATTPAVIAETWRRNGPTMLDELVGDIAGVLVERGSGRLHAFRDLCGGRPLHVARDADGWKAASEWRTLASAAAEPSRIWFASAFLGFSVDPRATPYSGVNIVLPGHMADPTASGWSQVRRADWHVPILRDRTPLAYADQFRELFDEAVRCRIEGHKSIGVALSGGLDSTSVMTSAAQIAPNGRRVAICMPFVEPDGDERNLQATVAERAGARVHWVDLDNRGPLGSNGPEEIFERFGSPPLVTNWFLGDAMAAVAEAEGLPVVLDGEDGDGSVGGSPAFLADLLVTGRWRRWYREVGAMRARDMAGRRGMLRQSLYLLAPRALRRAYMRRAKLELTPPVLAKGLRDELNLEERVLSSPLVPKWAPGRAFRLAQGGVGTAEQMAPVFTAISEPWRRRGVSLCHPWSDRRLMSFCMGLPFEHVCTGTISKLVLRQAMHERLPHEIVMWVRKADISEASRRRARGPEHAYVREGFRLARQQAEWFDPAVVDDIEAKFDTGEGDGSALRVAMFAWWLNWCESAAPNRSNGTALAAGVARW